MLNVCWKQNDSCWNSKYYSKFLRTVLLHILNAHACKCFNTLYATDCQTKFETFRMFKWVLGGISTIKYSISSTCKMKQHFVWRSYLKVTFQEGGIAQSCFTMLKKTRISDFCERRLFVCKQCSLETNPDILRPFYLEIEVSKDFFCSHHLSVLTERCSLLLNKQCSAFLHIYMYH